MTVRSTPLFHSQLLKEQSATTQINVAAENIPLTPPMPTGSVASVLDFQCLVITRTEGHGFLELTLLDVQTHFIASIRSHVPTFSAQSRRDHPVSTTPCPM